MPARRLAFRPLCRALVLLVTVAATPLAARGVEPDTAPPTAVTIATLADGIIIHPGGRVGWTVVRAPTGCAVSEAFRTEPGFVVADTTAVVLSPSGSAEERLEPGTARFVPAGANLRSPGGRAERTPVLAVTLRPTARAWACAGPANRGLLVADDGFELPAGTYAIRLARLDLGPDGDTFLPETAAPVAVVTNAGSLVVSEGERKQRRGQIGGQFAGRSVVAAGAVGASLLLATIEPAAVPPIGAAPSAAPIGNGSPGEPPAEATSESGAPSATPRIAPAAEPAATTVVVAQAIVPLTDAYIWYATRERLDPGEGRTMNYAPAGAFVVEEGTVALWADGERAALLGAGDAVAIGGPVAYRWEAVGPEGASWVEIFLAVSDLGPGKAADAEWLLGRRGGGYLDSGYGWHRMVVRRVVVPPGGRLAQLAPAAVGDVVVFGLAGRGRLSDGKGGLPLVVEEGEARAAPGHISLEAGPAGVAALVASLEPLPAGLIEPVVGEVEVRFLACPEGVTAAEASEERCGRTDFGGEFRLSLFGSDLSRPLAELGNAEGWGFWASLPPGDYRLEAIALPPGFVDFAIGGRDSADERFVPERAPDGGFVLPIDEANPWYALDLFFLVVPPPPATPAADAG